MYLKYGLMLIIFSSVFNIGCSTLTKNKLVDSKRVHRETQSLTNDLTEIRIRAKGTIGNENIELFINNKKYETYLLSKEYKEYFYFLKKEITIEDLSLKFKEIEVDQDIQIDFIEINKRKFQEAESGSYSVGSNINL